MESKTVKKSAKKAVAKTAKKVATKKVETKVKDTFKEVEKTATKVESVVKEKKSSKHSLFKAIAITILVGVLLSWIIPTGTFSSTDGTFTVGEITRTGLNELFLAIFYGINYYLVQVVFVLFVGLFYGVIRHTKGYKTLVDQLVNFWRGKEKFFVLVNTAVIALFVSMATQQLAILMFIPLVMTIAYRLGYSKVNSFATTFGAMIVGMIGQTFSTYGSEYITSYMNVKLTSGIALRFGLLIIGIVLLNLFIQYMASKESKLEKGMNALEEVKDDVFAPTSLVGGKSVGYIVLFAILFVVMILGFMPWSDAWEITAFTDFNTLITSELVVTIGETEHPILGYILGSIPAFGAWDLFTFASFAFITLIVVKLATKIKLDDALEYALDGLKAMLKPAIFVSLAYSLFVICYWSGFTMWIVDVLNNFGSFNPYTNAIANFIATVFHVDFGYSGFSLSAAYATRFADYTTQIFNSMIAMNGIASLVAPTSVVLVAGLSMYDVSYKDWMKYIWKFAVAMFVVVLVILTVMTYL